MIPSSPRVSQACLRCREKKRRCDGKKPKCHLCARFRLECNYPDYNGRMRLRASQMTAPSSSIRSIPVLAANSRGDEARRQGLVTFEQRAAVASNSGTLSAALVRAQLQGKDPIYNSPGPRHSAPWNLGIGFSRAYHPLFAEQCQEEPLSAITDWESFSRHATTYFTDVHPIFGSFLQDEFWESAAKSWEHTPYNTECYGARMSYVGALGALFSHDSHASTTFFRHAERHLNIHLLTDRSTMLDIDSLILRTLYLRLTISPHASWLSSWTMIGVVEGLPDEFSDVEADSSQSPERADAHDFAQVLERVQRKRILMARLLNAWISNENGCPRPGRVQASLGGTSIPSWAPRSPSWDLLRLYDLSESLDPRSPEADISMLEELLITTCRFDTDHDVVMLSKTNLAIVIFRRWRWKAKSSNMSTESIARLVEAGSHGLQAVERLALQHKPWHHVANVPFQVLCTLLLLDTRESLSLVGSALATLKIVRDIFNTPTTVVIFETAIQLVSLAKERKEGDSVDLSSAMQMAIEVAATPGPADEPAGYRAGGPYTHNGNISLPPDDMISGLPNWDDIDWDAMLAGEGQLWLTQSQL